MSQQANILNGNVNQPLKFIEYQGGTTNTATVHINDKVITVDANIADAGTLEAQIQALTTNYALLEARVAALEAQDNQ